VFNVFKQFIVLVEKRIGNSIKCLRTYNRGKFMSLKFENYFKEAGIKRNETTVYTLQQNGMEKYTSMDLLERERGMPNNSKFQQELWVEEVTTTCYLVNGSSSIAIDWKIHEEVWTGYSCI
jgi:hypothetical protein